MKRSEARAQRGKEAKMQIIKPTSEVVRKGLVVIPKEAPNWINHKYLADCMENKELQKKWKPKVGDWYFCVDLYEILKIKSLDEYNALGMITLSSDLPIGNYAEGCCDVYIPEPGELEKILRQ